MGYLNIVMQYGVENFFISCADSGVSGVIIPDLPFRDYMEEIRPLAKRYGVPANQTEAALIELLQPTTHTDSNVIDTPIGRKKRKPTDSEEKK